MLARVAVAAYAVSTFGRSWFYTRGLEMGLLGDRLVHGHGLDSPFGPPTGPTAMIAPGYPLLVAGVFRLLGSYSQAAEFTLISLNIIANVLTVWLILRVSRRLAGERPALCVATFWACSPPLLWMPTIFWETSGSTLLLLGFAEIAVRLRSQSKSLQWVTAGAFCGLAGLINPALLPTLLAVAAWAGWTGRACRVLRHATLTLLGFLVVYSPWPMRNACVFHAWIPTRTTIGFELWMGNRPGATGFLEQALFPTYNRTELASYRAAGEVRYMNQKSELAAEYIRAHPVVFLRMTLVRATRFWTGSGNREGSPFFVFHGLLTALLGGAGLLCLLCSADRKIAPVLLLPLILFPLPYYLTHAEFRYRLVLDPVLVVLSAEAFDQPLVARVLSRIAGTLQANCGKREFPDLVAGCVAIKDVLPSTVSIVDALPSSVKGVVSESEVECRIQTNARFQIGSSRNARWRFSVERGSLPATSALAGPNRRSSGYSLKKRPISPIKGCAQ